MRIRHFWTQYSRQPDAESRHRVALKTWSVQGWEECPLTDDMIQHVHFENGRAFPHVYDFFDKGVEGLSPLDIAVYTNDDICCRTDLSWQIQKRLEAVSACYAYRRDFNHDFQQPIPDADIAKGQAYAGSDLYAFRVGWWQQARQHMPKQMCIGLEAADPILRTLIERSHRGRDVILRDAIYHRRHGGPTHWEHPNNRYRMRGQQMVLRAAAKWLLAHGISPAQHGIPRGFWT